MEDDDFLEFQDQFRANIMASNNTPQADFFGLSPTQIMGLNHHPLQEGCVLRWKSDIPEETLEKVPMLTFALILLRQLAEKPLKLTAKGNLPRKVVKDLYATGLIPQADIETGITKLNSEDNYYAAVTLKHLLNLVGWTKKRQGKLSLTNKGKKVLAGPQEDILKALFLAHFTQFNLAFFDAYSDEGEMQHFFGFVLVSLLKKGKIYRPAQEYGEFLLRAFPQLVHTFTRTKWQTPEKSFCQAVGVRFFDRSLAFYGLLRFREKNRFFQTHHEFMATDLFRSLFYLDESATKPEPPGYEDAQIRAALLDAETGGTTWTSGDLPQELEALFHEQVRAFHAENGAGKVTIGSLVQDLEIKDISSFENQEELLLAINELLETLIERNVLFQVPLFLPIDQLYELLITDLLNHEIPEPNSQLPAFIHYDALESELLVEFPETVLVAEALLMSLFHLEEPMPESIFHETMRLGDRIVPRAAAITKAESWRQRWAEITPLQFTPGPSQMQSGFNYQFIEMTFQTIDHKGNTKNHDWVGVVELIEVLDEWQVYGASFTGNHGDFKF